MKIAAVIAEYNPFHNGHLYQLQEIRRRTEAELILVMMSGDFVQRGGPACIDKYTRCQMALASGADIVCELPVYGALGSAEIFASSAVSLLNHLGCIDYLCFGAENDQLEYFEKIAHVLTDEPQPYRDMLKESLREGLNFPAARSRALYLYLQDSHCSDILSMPNNILAIEYMKALHRTGSSIRPVLIKRKGADYHSTDTSEIFSSATAIRKCLENLSLHAHNDSSTLDRLPVPAITGQYIQKYLASKGLLTANDFSLMLAYRLLEPGLDLMRYVDITEDIANRIDSFKNQFQSTEQFTELLVSRNLTATRVSRCLFHILLGHEKDIMNHWKSTDYSGYLHVLGFKTSAANFWKEVPDSFKDQLVMRTSRDGRRLTGFGQEMFQADLYASRLYRQTLSCRFQLQLPAIESEPLIILGNKAYV